MDPRLDLVGALRPQLAMMEDNLIFALFARSKFKTNSPVYDGQVLPVGLRRAQNVSDYFPIVTHADLPPSLLDVVLEETERLHARLGRFNHPEEYPFTQGLPVAVLKRDYGPSPIKRVGLNWNPHIKKAYLGAIPQFCTAGDDNNYGSSAVLDVSCLFALSHRIHFGQYVAESKFQSDPTYRDLIIAGDRAGIMGRLTNSVVEAQVLERVKQKGERYGFNPEFIMAFYRDQIIPMTKDVEVEYLIQRGIDNATK